MTEDRFDELMRDAAQTYRTPPEAPLDEMWTGISASLAADSSDQRPATSRANTQWFAIAATLVIGIGLGRVSTSVGKNPASKDMAPSVAMVIPTHVDSVVNNPYELETSKYLGRTAALLIALPSEVKAGRANAQFAARAGELLTTTRLLIDSPASNDPDMRNLLEDLELVLAQVVRLQNNHSRTESRTELDLINRALEQRDVLPRLRSAAAISAN